MKIYKNSAFHRWAREIRLSDDNLVETIVEMNAGKIDSNLGGNVYKQRVALSGRGKRGSARTIIAFKCDKAAFFIYGFAKNARANIENKELNILKKLAELFFSYDNEQLARAVKRGELVEVIMQ